MESKWTPLYESAYIQGIHNLYEFDVGSGSGWMYSVNDWYPNYGCSCYTVQPGDVDLLGLYLRSGTGCRRRSRRGRVRRTGEGRR